MIGVWIRENEHFLHCVFNTVYIVWAQQTSDLIKIYLQYFYLFKEDNNTHLS